MSNGWHYQLMKHVDQQGYTYYAIHEYYPGAIMGEGENDGWTLEPVRVTGESKEDVVWALKAMLHDIEKYGEVDYE